ncbi:MAG: Ig-like domain-containing protein [Clostridia bacterium]|nr:Ig-like domain-containing protein [Clostridia bacterium]
MGVGEPGVYASEIAYGDYLSSDESVVRVDGQSGALTALRPGTALVSADEGRRTWVVTVLKAPSALEVQDKTQYMMLGSSVSPLNATAREGEWAGRLEVRLSGSAARLTQDGLIYGADVGSVTVTLKSYNGIKCSYTLQVRVKPKSMELNLSEAELGVGESLTLEAAFEPKYSYSCVEYSISEEGILIPGEAPGSFTAKTEGSTTLYAQSENGLTAACAVRVLPLPNEILCPERVLAAVGARGQLDCTTPQGTRARLVYESLTPDVLEISEGGAWRVLKEGNGLARVSAAGTNLQCDIPFELLSAPKSIAFSKKELSMCVGQSLSLSLDVTPAGTYAGAAFRSSNPRCAEVDQNGCVKALGQGTCTITAEGLNGLRAQIIVRVLKQPDELTLDQSFLSLSPGQRVQLSCSYAKNSYTPIVWESLSPGVASVDAQSGEVTALSGGTAAIVARGLNGQKATCLVSVDAETDVPVELEIVFMDIDTNDAIILRSGDEYAFIDSGSHPYGEKAAAFMEEMGITHLKYYIGTHGHLDHIGGACVILSRFDVDMVIVPHERVIRAIQGSVWTEEERAAAAAASYCVLPAGGRIYLGSVPFDCIGPITVKSVRTTDTKENDNSLVLRALVGSKTILLTGDATVNEFNAIMRAYPDSIQCDVFKNTHHAGELSDQQIKAIAPKIVVFSTSSLRLPSNRYRQLFEKLGSEIYITAERINGNVTLYTDGETIAVTCQYENNRAAWDKAHGAAK